MNTAENSAATTRRRWAAAFGAATMLWCAWWYTRGGGAGVLWALAALGAVAVALPRPLPGTARWRIWTWLFVTFVCLVANVERIMPAEKATDGVYFLHRIVTAFLAVGAAGLFFRLNRLTATIVAAGAAPMIMRALSLESVVKAQTTPLQGQAAIWGYIAMVVAFDAACRHAERRRGPASRRGERIGRVALLLAALALSAALFTPVKRSAYEMQRILFGWSGRMGRGFMTRRSPDILLGVPLPKGFRNLTRVVLLVESDRAPGYLRENVYTAYQGGRWIRGDAGEPLDPLESAAGAWRAYPLAEAPAEGGTRRMAIEMFAPGLVDSYCVPGAAVALHSDGDPPRMDVNGMLTAEGAMPGRYQVDVEAGALSDRAFQRPRGTARREYLAIPAGLAASVSNWVASCEGLAAARGAREAAACIEGDFAARFAYRLDVRLSSAPDPLVHFMARREGYCVHFASAAALMLRVREVPTRVVGGFVGTERSPWLDRWVVREREGHAWVEAWDETDGRWFIVEATPSAGLPEQFEDPGRIRRTLDVLVSLWKRFLYWIGQAGILIVVADATAVAFIFAFDVLWGPPGIGLLAAVGAFSLWRRRRRRRRRTREEALRAALTGAMARTARGLTPERLGRRETENWDAWLERIGPEIPPETAVKLHDIVERYQRLRYRRRLDIEATEAWIREQGNAWIDGGESR